MAFCTMTLLEAGKPHFCKIILDNSVCVGKLGIPKKFVRTCGDDLLSPVILKVPNGVRWKVDLVKCDGQIWLTKGWREFSEYYSVGHGTFLLFEYENESEFNVVIFDESCTEICYPFSNGGERPNLDEQFQEPNIEESDDVSVETLPPKKARVNEAEGGMKSLFYQGRQRVNITSERKIALTKGDKNKAVHIANENPCFSIVMQPSYVQKNICMPIPAKFGRKYLKKGDAIIILDGLDGRRWPISLYTATSFGKVITKIKTSGWRQFVKDNNLDVGDKCVFQLLLEYVDQTVFRVSISKYNLSNRKQLKEKGSRSSGKEPNSNTTFQITMKPSNFFHRNKYYLHVPNKFVKNMKQTSGKAKLQIDNKLWAVKLNMYEYGGTKKGVFGEGWMDFGKENCVQVGDVCSFEMIDREMLLIKVSITTSGSTKLN